MRISKRFDLIHAIATPVVVTFIAIVVMVGLYPVLWREVWND